ncbi:FAD:protein FMN transferase [uncultured Bifidobacterium sp.]|uniref:FAD:protein FMN transferase n=1 Tax=uncultured Bifidobacterium sp. TaxID=165187 RepID=UPI0028DD1B6B|nr:FAD:protein FMN transferase [uncultured Bifidobacterium sp.]
MFSTHRVALGTLVAQCVDVATRIEADSLFREGDDVLANVQTALDRGVPFGDVARCVGFEGDSRRVGELTYAALAEARTMYRLSAGAFDPTVAPVTDLWRRCGAAGRVPSSDALEYAARLVDGSRMRLDGDSRTVRLERGQSLSLAGLARGFAADHLVDAYGRAGVASAFVNVGGRIRIIGPHPGHGPWSLAVPDPNDASHALTRPGGPRSAASIAPPAHRRLATLRLSGSRSEADPTNRGSRAGRGLAVVTRMLGPSVAGSHGRHVLGVSATIDPRTGLPVSGDLAAATIVASSASFADALALAVLVLGLEEGMQLVDSLPGVDGLIVTRRGTVVMTHGLSSICHPAKGVRSDRFRIWG